MENRQIKTTPQSLCPIEIAAEKTPHHIAVIEGSTCYSYDLFHQEIEKCKSFIPNEGLLINEKNSFRLLCKFFAALRLNKSILFVHEQINLKKIAGYSIEDFFSRFDLKNPKICFLTSGSSHLPKIVIHTYSSLKQNALQFLDRFPLIKEDIWRIPIPMTHIGGFSAMLRTFLSSATILLEEKHVLFSERPFTHLSIVPTQLFRILQESNVHTLPSFAKMMLVGGAPLCEQHFIKAKESNLPIYLTYGMTETGSQVLISNQPYWDQGEVYLGMPHPEIEIQWKENELFLKGKSLFEGYLGQPSPFTKEGFFPTKDLGKMHPKYGLTITGRKDRMFISGGENIYPEEIERAFLKIYPNNQVFVSSISDPEFGQITILYTDLLENRFSEALENLKKLLPNFKVPKSFLPKANLNLKTGQGLKTYFS